MWFMRQQELCIFVYNFQMSTVQLIYNVVDLCGLSSNYFDHLFCYAIRTVNDSPRYYAPSYREQGRWHTMLGIRLVIKRL